MYRERGTAEEVHVKGSDRLKPVGVCVPLCREKTKITTNRVMASVCPQPHRLYVEERSIMEKQRSLNSTHSKG
eukprot:CAMPEP_0206631870 /NCGR_PEP_ID=MMETSP0325_2-20121206/68537_1 /ASSEMBLY_ACC=CAM_ASM_000347 /TAXON_ID=2866 /ORGANISM="Crypthecodinium cohnii, Strain Seligo" /LENGTH=72 /DNA_ID=CAMNT_0054157225 /DNA_START=21 /DNA_END=236 /DNA_ORIENTATION=+